MYIRPLTVLLTVVFLVLLSGVSGCSTIPGADKYWNTAKTEVREAKTDHFLESLDYICEGAAVGDIRRHYGKNADLAKAYEAQCGASASVIRPE